MGSSIINMKPFVEIDSDAGLQGYQYITVTFMLKEVN